MIRLDTDSLVARPGRPLPLGTTVTREGVNFAIFSRHATRMWLALFDDIHETRPAWETLLDPRTHREGDVWAVEVLGVAPGTYYAYRADGPYHPPSGHYYDANKLLLDPYARAVVGSVTEGTLKGVVTPTPVYGGRPPRPRIPTAQSIVYEVHVRGLTQHHTSGVTHRGTYRGLIEKIPYLRDLGVTAIELLPVHFPGEVLMGRDNPLTHQPLVNYWGYNTIGFFAPATHLACSAVTYEHLDEFREMTDALHAAGLECWLDVVYNHTSEGNEKGPTQSFRGLDNSIYYMLTPEGLFYNYSGCGNTVLTAHPVVQDLVVDSLRYWVLEMGVDGFRFDLGTVLNRDQEGNLLQHAPMVQRIAEDAVLRDVKMISEAWDNGAAYQVGHFGSNRWAEWNGKFRDEVRQFWRGDANMRGKFATRITGSSDLYNHSGRTPHNSINMITQHDGYTLRDLVTYTERRNWANGEDNRDGEKHNFSFNCGVEGETDDPTVNALRLRQQKNFLATMFLSIGVPMLLGGDEFGRTQRGNNNPYCQDNDISWYDWTLAMKNNELIRFVRGIIRFRKRNIAFTRDRFFTGQPNGDPSGEPDVRWFDERGKAPQWRGGRSTLAWWINGNENEGVALYLMYNALDVGVEFVLPKGDWKMQVHTARPAPFDVADDDTPRIAEVRRRILLPRKTMVVLAG